MPRGYNKLLPDYTGGVDYRNRKDLMDAYQEHQANQRITEIKTTAGNSLLWLFAEGTAYAKPERAFYYEYPATKAISTLSYDQIVATMNKFGKASTANKFMEWFNYKSPYFKYLTRDLNFSVDTSKIGGHGILGGGL